MMISPKFLYFHCNLQIIILVLHLLVLERFASCASAQVFMPSCSFQEVNLVPCLISSSGGDSERTGNISEACCRSLNQALDAGHRCFCSVLLSTNVLAGLTSLSTLPLVLPLPGCYLYAPSLAVCQVTVLQTNAPPAAAAASMEAAAAAAAAAAVLPPPPQAAAVRPPSKKNAAGKKAEEMNRRGASISKAEEEERQSHRSNAYRRHLNMDGGGTYMMTLFAMVIAINILLD